MVTGGVASGADKDERLDNGTSDIDSLDSFEYSFEKDLKKYARSVA